MGLVNILKFWAYEAMYNQTLKQSLQAKITLKT